MHLRSELPRQSQKNLIKEAKTVQRDVHVTFLQRMKITQRSSVSRGRPLRFPLVLLRQNPSEPTPAPARMCLWINTCMKIFQSCWTAIRCSKMHKQCHQMFCSLVAFFEVSKCVLEDALFYFCSRCTINNPLNLQDGGDVCAAKGKRYSSSSLTVKDLHTFLNPLQ